MSDNTQTILKTCAASSIALHRNLNRVKRNIREITLQINDIENAYPHGNAPKSIAREHWDLEKMLEENIDLEAGLKRIMTNRIEGL